MGWKQTLDLSDIWNQVDNNNITLTDFLKLFIERAKKLDLKDISKHYLQHYIIQPFEIMVEEKNLNKDYFDEIFCDFYDFCDAQRILVKKA